MFWSGNKTLNFDQNEDESCVYKKMYRNMVVFFIIDDIQLTRNDVELLSSIKI